MPVADQRAQRLQHPVASDERGRGDVSAFDLEDTSVTAFMLDTVTSRAKRVTAV